MKILGISHDVLVCSAAVVVDGEVVAAIAEERLDRQKQSRIFPKLAIQKCLEMSGLEISDIDEIAVGWNPVIDLETAPSGFVEARRWRGEHLSQVPAQFMKMFGGPAADEFTVDPVSQGYPPITYVNHYAAHLGNALMDCPQDEVAVLILDGRGEKQTSLQAVVRGTEVEHFAEVNFPHSMGLFYGTVTEFLGFRADSDEWKVMALAAFAETDNEFVAPMRELVSVNPDGTFELTLEYFQFYNIHEPRMFSDRFVNVFGEPRAAGQPLGQREYKIAAAMQIVFEDSANRIAEALHRKTGLKHLAVSGGSFMNSVYNGKMEDVTPFEKVYISSCPDDSGTSVGAAVYLHNQKQQALEGKNAKRAGIVQHTYWGPEYTDEHCLAVAEQYRLPNVEVVDAPSQRAAADLANGRILGWFQGKMEFGQRALGNRSILLDPRRTDGKEIVNSAVKFRESFRPFAPAILADRVHEWFVCDEGTMVPYMERVLMFRESKRNVVPAVTHADGSGRLQTVTEQANSRFYDLIEEFERLTDVPIVLNTSFNLNGEPIVCSPEDAIRTFFTCGLEVLYLGNVRISK